jgi:hypothetical protein
MVREWGIPTGVEGPEESGIFTEGSANLSS